MTNSKTSTRQGAGNRKALLDLPEEPRARQGEEADCGCHFICNTPYILYHSTLSTPLYRNQQAESKVHTHTKKNTKKAQNNFKNVKFRHSHYLLARCTTESNQ